MTHISEIIPFVLGAVLYMGGAVAVGKFLKAGRGPAIEGVDEGMPQTYAEFHRTRCFPPFLLGEDVPPVSMSDEQSAVEDGYGRLSA